MTGRAGAAGRGRGLTIGLGAVTTISGSWRLRQRRVPAAPDDNRNSDPADGDPPAPSVHHETLDPDNVIILHFVITLREGGRLSIEILWMGARWIGLQVSGSCLGIGPGSEEESRN